MLIRMTAHDYETSRDVEVSQGNIDFLGDVGELFLTFLHSVGYTYVNQVVIVKDNGEEVSTVL